MEVSFPFGPVAAAGRASRPSLMLFALLSIRYKLGSRLDFYCTYPTIWKSSWAAKDSNRIPAGGSISWHPPPANGLQRRIDESCPSSVRVPGDFFCKRRVVTKKKKKKKSTENRAHVFRKDRARPPADDNTAARNSSVPPPIPPGERQHLRTKIPPMLRPNGCENPGHQLVWQDPVCYRSCVLKYGASFNNRKGPF